MTQGRCITWCNTPQTDLTPNVIPHRPGAGDWGSVAVELTEWLLEERRTMHKKRIT